MTEAGQPGLAGKAGDFLALHHGNTPLLQPNAWDAGSARILAALGFSAIATTSSGFAATLGRADGRVSRDEVLEHCRTLSAAVDIPVAADTENCFADEPDGVAETVRLAAQTGLAGCSIEDFTRNREAPIYDVELAADRVRAAAAAAHGGSEQLVLTARAENLLHGVDDLDDTIKRLRAYQEAGADVLFAPGIRKLEQVRAIVTSVDRPVNVLVVPGCPSVPELAAAGVARISVGGSFTFAAYGAMVDAAKELLQRGTVTFRDTLPAAREVFVSAFRA
jgi:2-methylisocitrate lyase-like PEP mutase family enzyme